MEDFEEDEESVAGKYDNGHWAWDDKIGGGLVFISHEIPKPAEPVNVILDIQAGAMLFKDNVDLLEQVRFQKRYVRKLKAGEPDIITLQDVKDIAMFTAPLAIQSAMIINMLHLPTTDRLLRALILYCQYYLQVEEEMTARILELEKKARTTASDEVEAVYRENLTDIRTLVAKEYSCVILGAAELRNYHHKGPKKQQKSLGGRDAKLFECLLRFCIQIVWLALSRRSYNIIELELNRIFKTDTFNSVEHTHKTRYIQEMNKLKRDVLMGPCLKKYSKLKCVSPLMDEIFCQRPIDFRMMGIGVVKYDELDARQHYFMMALAGPESELMDHNVTVGVLGLPRSFFDTMLNVVPGATTDQDKTKSYLLGSKSTSTKTRPSKGTIQSKSRSAGGSTLSGTTQGSSKQDTRIYQNIMLPAKPQRELPLPPEFPKAMAPVPRIYNEQRKRWLHRLDRLTRQATTRASAMRVPKF